MLTVTTRAATGRLVTLDDARLDLGLSAEAVPNPRLARIIDQASGRVSSYCNRTFGRQIYRETILCFPENGLLLGAGPVNRIISVGILGGAGFDAAEYALSDGQLRLTHGPRPGWGDGSAYNLWRSIMPTIVVDYEAGWLLPGEDIGETFQGDVPLPAEVEAAVMQLVAVAAAGIGRDPTVKSETVEGIGSTSFYVQGAAAGLPHPAAETALQPYRNLVLL